MEFLALLPDYADRDSSRIFFFYFQISIDGTNIRCRYISVSYTMRAKHFLDTRETWLKSPARRRRRRRRPAVQQQWASRVRRAKYYNGTQHRIQMPAENLSLVSKENRS